MGLGGPTGDGLTASHGGGSGAPPRRPVSRSDARQSIAVARHEGRFERRRHLLANPRERRLAPREDRCTRRSSVCSANSPAIDASVDGGPVCTADRRAASRSDPRRVRGGVREDLPEQVAAPFEAAFVAHHRDGLASVGVRSRTPRRRSRPCRRETRSGRRRSVHGDPGRSSVRWMTVGGRRRAPVEARAGVRHHARPGGHARQAGATAAKSRDRAPSRRPDRCRAAPATSDGPVASLSNTRTMTCRPRGPRSELGHRHRNPAVAGESTPAGRDGPAPRRSPPEG